MNVEQVAGLSKRERVEMLLDHWQDFHETLHAVDHDHAGGGDGDAIPGMPRMYHHPSVRELHRAILAVAATDDDGDPTGEPGMRVNVAHLLAYYEAEWRNVTRFERRKTKKGRFEVVEARKRERVVPKGVRHQKVRLAFDAVVAEFRGPVHIPDELLEDIQQAA